MAGTMSIGGVSSGIKTDEIISKYMEYASRGKTLLENKKAAAQQKLTAWQDLNTRVLALQANSQSIASVTAFQTKQVTSSMEDVVKATASSDAVAGSYYINVVKSAKSHQIASQSYSGMDAGVSEGTIRITVNGGAKEIKIDSTNNTLLGVKDAINKADAGVRASVINEGTTSSPSYSLVLTSNETGTDHKMVVDAGTTGLAIGNDENGAGSRREVQAAEDAQVKMGSLTFTRSSNTITDIIPGVTLNVANPDETKTVKIEVTQDTDSAKKAIKNFVDQYNDIMKTINDMTDYDATTGQTGIFLGNMQVQSLQMDLESAVTGSVSGIPTEKGKQTYNALSTIGITTGTDGLLTIDDSDLSDALANHSAEVGKLFGTTLDSDNTNVSLVSTTADTQPSGIKGYDISITQAATRTTITAGSPIGDTINQAETLTINGKSISLQSGMTRDAVIAEINKRSLDTNVTAFDTLYEGQHFLSLRANQYGSSREITAVSSLSLGSYTGTTGLGYLSISSTSSGEQSAQYVAGLDVVGTINGEEATGKGQVLSADPKSAKSPVKGLQVISTSAGPLDTTGVLTKGVGTRLKEILTSMTSSNGLFNNTQDSMKSDVDDIAKDISDMEERLATQQARLESDFNKMESQLGTLQQQGNALASQLSALSSK